MQATGRYFVKFGIAHAGPRLDYPSMLEPLGLKSIEAATRADGVHFIMVTTIKGRSCLKVVSVVNEYNMSEKAAREGLMGLMHVVDGFKLPVVVFSRAVSYHEHEFYQCINDARLLKTVGERYNSSYWFWSVDGAHLHVPVSTFKIRSRGESGGTVDQKHNIAKSRNIKRKRVYTKRVRKPVNPSGIVEVGEWDEFQV